VIIYSYRKSGRGDIVVTFRIFKDELGVTRKLFEKALNAVNALEANALPLTNLDSLLNRKVRHDIVRLKSINFIRDYSHNDDNSHRLDSNESNSKKINGVRHRPRYGKMCLYMMKSMPTSKNPLITSNSKRRIPPWIWEKQYLWNRFANVYECKIQNSSQSQMELRSKERSWRQLAYRLRMALLKARRRHVELNWTSHQFKVLQLMLDPKHGMSIFTNFAATTNLSADKSDNSAVDGHAIIAVFFTYNNQRHVFYMNSNGEGDYHIVTKCSVTQFIGGTESRGKSNDWVFHNRCLEELIPKNEESREGQFDADGNELVYTYFVCTDGCPNQYKCQHKFLSAAKQCCERFPNKIRIVCMIATKYGFEGPWDGDGGSSKSRLANEELKKKRLPDALAAFKTLKDTMTMVSCDLPVQEWIENEDRRIIRKAPSVMDERQYKFVTHRRPLYDSLKADGDKYSNSVFFLERNPGILLHQSTPKTALKGTKKHYQFRTPTEAMATPTANELPAYEIVMTKYPCACLKCRTGDFDGCLYLADMGPLEKRKVMSQVNY